jgi:outer membrane protein OmpA-like peptidoglycan-associated protein
MRFEHRAVGRMAVAAAVVALVSLTAAPHAEAQFGKKLKRALQDNAEQKAIQKAVDGQNKAIDGATSGGNKADSAAAGGAAGETAATAGATATAAAPASKKEWANYDFVPGERVLFYTDFSEEKAGNFPSRLEFLDGQMEVVELDGVRTLKASGSSHIAVPLPQVLPEKYTIELDIISRNSNCCGSPNVVVGGGKDPRDHNFSNVSLGHNWIAVGGNNKGENHATLGDGFNDRYRGKLGSFRIMGDGKYLKVYADEKRYLNIPNANFKRDKVLWLAIEGRDEGNAAVYVSKIRIAESKTDILYDALAAKGRWATQGILFETGKADIRPESTPTLKNIGQTLKEHADLKVLIEGHTDNVGKAADNQKLSEARAQAVKQAIVKEYGIDDARVTVKGYGDAKPVGDNKTPEGRQNNRRVELVKQ